MLVIVAKYQFKPRPMNLVFIMTMSCVSVKKKGPIANIKMGPLIMAPFWKPFGPISYLVANNVVLLEGGVLQWRT